MAVQNQIKRRALFFGQTLWVKTEALSTLLSLCLCISVLFCEEGMLTAPGQERVVRTQEKARSGMPGRQDVCEDAALWSPLVSGTIPIRGSF